MVRLVEKTNSEITVFGAEDWIIDSEDGYFSPVISIEHEICNERITISPFLTNLSSILEEVNMHVCNAKVK